LVSSANHTASAGFTTSMFQACPDGKRVVGGGYEWSGNPALTISSSSPATVNGADGWRVVATNTGTTSRLVTIRAICLTAAE
ncbi:MAG: hypothetical protein ACRDGE_08205, partial [Candidatus Limnocylindria bacterium]